LFTRAREGEPVTEANERLLEKAGHAAASIGTDWSSFATADTSSAPL